MRVWCLCCVLVLCVGVLWVEDVGATIVPTRSLTQQLQAADRVVRGKILSKRALWGPQRRHIYTDYRLEVLEVLKGPAAKVLTFRQLGGVYGKQTVRIAGSAHYRLGEEVLLLFEPERKPGFLFVQGLAAGKFEVLRQDGKVLLHRQTVGLAFYNGKHKIAHRNYSEQPIALSALRKQLVELKRKAPRLRPHHQHLYKTWIHKRMMKVLKARRAYRLKHGKTFVGPTLRQRIAPLVKRPMLLRALVPKPVARPKLPTVLPKTTTQQGGGR